MKIINSVLAHHRFLPWKYRNGERLVSSESYWKQPLRWNRVVRKNDERWNSQALANAFPKTRVIFTKPSKC